MRPVPRRFLLPAVAVASALAFLPGVSPLSSRAVGGEETAPDPAAAASAAGSEEESLPPGVLARVDGRDVTVDEYAQYLLASVGRSLLDEYVNRLLLEKRARELGVSIDPEDVESAVEEEVERTIKSLYGGDRDAYVKALEARRSSLEEETVRLRQEVYYDRLLDELVRKTRDVSQEDVRRHFERIYGEDGVQYILRHILISSAVGPEDRGAAGRSPKEAEERAERVLAELEKGLDFTQAVKRYSDDTFTRENDGRLPAYRKGLYGPAFHAAVEELSEDDPISGVVESPRGFHLIQLVEKRRTEFEDVEDEVQAAVKDRPPTPSERQALLRELREEADIEGL